MKKNNDTDAPYGLYIDYDCVEEFDDLTDAENAFNNAVKENPDSIIDIWQYCFQVKDETTNVLCEEYPCNNCPYFVKW